MSGPAIVSLAALDEPALLRKLARLRRRASSLRPGAPADPCLQPASRPSAALPFRAAVVASSCEEAAAGALMLERRLLRFPGALPYFGSGAVVARADAAASIGLLFPGQGSPAMGSIGPLGEHVPAAADLHRRVGLPRARLPKELIQLAIVGASIAALRALDSLGVRARFSIGHSLGELVALHWAGAYDRATLLRLSRARGRAMVRDATGGAMAVVRADERQLPDLLGEEQVAIACFNTPRQHVVSGEEEAVAAILRRARVRRIGAARLDVTGAFHSPLMATAAQTFGEEIGRLEIGTVRRRVASTVTGRWIEPGEDVRGLLVRQIGSPVRFSRAIGIATDADLFVEVGPGQVLSGLVRELTETPVLSLPAGGSERSFREGIAALWACGVLRSAPRRLGQSLDPSLETI